MLKKHSSLFLTILGLCLVLGSLLAVAVLDRPLADRQPVTFTTATGDLLVGAYTPGTEAVGVILLEGFGSDQVTMTSLASEFARSGWHVFTFDFSGHGRSPGMLTFDNAQTDRLAYQALSALQEFKKLSGLSADQIFFAGHSLGARVALQSATLNPERVAGLILLGTQVNLSTNAQSEFFTGTTDTALPWVQALGPENPPVPILLVSGAWDDILTPKNAELLYQRLGGGQTGSNRTLLILPAMLHNYEPFSFRVLAEMAKWENRLTQPPTAAAVRIFSWICGLIGIFLLLIGGNRWAGSSGVNTRAPLNLQINDVRRFLWGKLLLWLGALPLAAILGGLFFIIPLGKPVLNLIYVGFIGGYGILLLILYRRGKMPGVRGKLLFGLEKKPLAWKPILVALGIVVVMLVLTAAYARTGWFYVFPLNVRLLWLILFTPFTALGFWIGLYEAQMLPQRRGPQTALALIGLFPFFLYTLLMAAIGSLSGMVGGLQGLIILWLVLAFGNLLQTIVRRPWITALCMAVLLYWLILPQGVLF